MDKKQYSEANPETKLCVLNTDNEHIETNGRVLNTVNEHVNYGQNSHTHIEPEKKSPPDPPLPKPLGGLDNISNSVDGLGKDGCVCESAVLCTSQTKLNLSNADFCPYKDKLITLINIQIDARLQRDGNLPAPYRGRKTNTFWESMCAIAREEIQRIGWLSPNRIKLHPILNTHFSNPHQYSRLRAILLAKYSDIVVFKLLRAFSPYYVTTVGRVDESRKNINLLMGQRKGGGFP